LSPAALPAPALPAGTRPARLARVDRSAWDVLTEDGPLRLPAPPRTEATVGDHLAVTDDAVVAVLPRTSLLSRGSASGTSTSQPLAANVDVVLLCAGLSGPVPVRRVERLLTLAWSSGATPVVVLTKADLHPDPAAAVRELQPHAPGADIVTVSAATGDVGGLAPYDTAGTTLVLLGASGAGKSTVVNALVGHGLMATGAIREVDGKGRHTTTHRELVVLPSGALLIDTPGLRAVAMHGDDAGLAQAFSDVEELAAACRFADCGHETEPGCAVQAGIATGELAPTRLDSWRHLQRELAFQARRTDARLKVAEKARWKAVHRQQRARGGRP
jgi:ribosome biogenesis GTPase